jgi:apolipoprotein N-acyltransferase
LKNKIGRAIFGIAAPCATGALLTLSFPAIDLGWLAWISLVPLLVSISGEKPHNAFFLSYVGGIAFFIGIGNWLFHIHGYRLLHHAIWGTYLAVYFGLFGLAFSFISRRWGVVPSLVASPFLWVALEYIRSNMGFMAFPWGLLSHSQYQHPRIIQVASFAGNYGVSFLVAWVNAALAAVILLCSRPSPSKFSAKHALILIVIGGVLITSALWYGHRIVSKPIVGKEIKVSVVQGNIEQAKKWDRSYRTYILERYEELSRKVSKDQPRLVIWPEAATPGFVLKDITLIRRITGIVREVNTYFLIGSSEYPKYQKGPLKVDQFGNTALFFSPDGRVLGQYLKIRLLPFGEYLPYGETIPWSYIRIPDPGSYVSGQEFTVFECSRHRFGVTICWETIFPDLVRRFVYQGAQFLVNITNEAWFGKSAAPYQFLSMNVFRAVENRVYVVRCANTGISCFIDPCGRIVDRVKDHAGQDIFVQGVLTKTILAMESKTIYTQYGDWFAWLCILVSAMAVILTCFKRSTPRHSIL